MRISLLSLFFLFLTLALAGQAPVNDNCAGAIDLGVLPADCSGQIYNNVNATASGLGAGNIPNCFNGGNVNRDVYFTFTTNDTLRDVSIILQGTDAGANGPITNPQVAIYRGDCVGGLAFLGFCLSAPSGSNQLQLDVLGLTPNTTYYLLVNDYSATAAPNSGDFTLCVEEYVPAVNIGDAPGSSSCFGTLYDDGGPDGDYGSNQNHTFVIEPAEFNQCIEISVLDFQLEANFDFVNIYAGDNTNGPLLATLNGFSSGQPFVIQSGSSAVTVEFFSDGSVQQGGFELIWSCSPLACDGSSFDNPIAISGLPFNQGGYSTCDDASNLTETPCTQAPFLFGPEVVFAYESAGGFCANVQVTGATPGTGIVVLDGPPDDPETQCLAQTAGGQASSVDFQDAGTYYIVVANGQGCTDFGLSITESSCSLNPSLLGSLCNPLNGCIDPSGLPSTFVFNQGFEDITFTPGVNDGCWLNTGSAQPNYYWFSIEAQADGPFGFIVQAATPGEESDIDFNVWGPFDRQQVCEEPLQVRDLIESTQPIRSSWAAGADPTGLAAVNANGEPVTDPYDCDPAPGAFGDDFASVIMAEQGEVYLV
ncbi:MAG: CUB domain-containing protein, partial [Phaeodactylibacter sp.]|nr:CUB domain-containing protein [Phaeodactylibacter sp.]